MCGVRTFFVSPSQTMALQLPTEHCLQQLKSLLLCRCCHTLQASSPGHCAWGVPATQQQVARQQRRRPQMHLRAAAQQPAPVLCPLWKTAATQLQGASAGQQRAAHPARVYHPSWLLLSGTACSAGSSPVSSSGTRVHLKVTTTCKALAVGLRGLHHRVTQGTQPPPQTMTVSRWWAASWQHVCLRSAAHLCLQGGAVMPVSPAGPRAGLPPLHQRQPVTFIEACITAAPCTACLAIALCVGHVQQDVGGLHRTSCADFVGASKVGEGPLSLFLFHGAA